ncbi:hypothetical protein ABZ639_13460, partial [Saccharomonospora sp. NPDC006951]
VPGTLLSAGAGACPAGAGDTDRLVLGDRSRLAPGTPPGWCWGTALGWCRGPCSRLAPEPARLVPGTPTGWCWGTALGWCQAACPVRPRARLWLPLALMCISCGWTRISPFPTRISPSRVRISLF